MFNNGCRINYENKGVVRINGKLKNIKTQLRKEKFKDRIMVQGINIIFELNGEM